MAADGLQIQAGPGPKHRILGRRCFRKHTRPIRGILLLHGGTNCDQAREEAMSCVSWVLRFAGHTSKGGNEMLLADVEGFDGLRHTFFSCDARIQRKPAATGIVISSDGHSPLVTAHRVQVSKLADRRHLEFELLVLVEALVLRTYGASPSVRSETFFQKHKIKNIKDNRNYS